MQQFSKYNIFVTFKAYKHQQMQRIRISSVIGLIFVLIFLSACTGDQKRFRQRLINTAIEYVSKQLKNPETRILRDSTIMVGDSTKRYFIQPSQVFSGLIDEDNITDGIVTVTLMERNGSVTNEHLIILNKENKLIMVRSVESEMKILSVKDRVISADVPTHPATNPLHGCPVCREVKKFVFKNGDLVLKEK